MMNVAILPILQDNYVFILIHEKSKEVWVVDPGVGEVVETYLRRGQYQLATILNTHHHYDHVGGNLLLQEHYHVPIIASHYDQENARIPGQTKAVKEGDVLSFHGINIHVLETPGHTLGHIAYYIPEEGILFIGDTLFSMGCGRLFEGSAETMFETLQKIKQLPPHTKVYCTHEYTLSNFAFAFHLGLDSSELQSRYQWAQARRNQNLPTIPVTLQEECLTNPFLQTTTVAAFAQLRRKKDVF